jgi:hypothetical protein
VSSSTPRDHEAPIRVLLADLTGLLAAIVAEALKAQRDIELVGVVQGQLEIMRAVDDDVDVLLLGVPQVQLVPEVAGQLLRTHPSMRIVVVTPNGDRAAFLWLGIRRRRAPVLSTRTLPLAIRQAYLIDRDGL